MNRAKCAHMLHHRGNTAKVQRIMGRRSFMQFEILHLLVQEKGTLTRNALRNSLPDPTPEASQVSVRKNLSALAADRLVNGGVSEKITLSDNLPNSFALFVRATAAWLRKDGNHLGRLPKMPAGYVSAARPLSRAAPGRMVPILFGNRRDQNILLLAARNGEVRLSIHVPTAHLERTGMVLVTEKPQRILTLNPGHIAAAEIRKCLGQLGGFTVPNDTKKRRRRTPIERVLPGNDGQALFRLLYRIIATDEPLEEPTLCRRIPDVLNAAVIRGLAKLVKDGVLFKHDDGTYKIADGVPRSFRTFIIKTAEWLAPEDPRIMHPSTEKGRRPKGLGAAQDGAPDIFGSDVRLRNLMMLAKYGPMLVVEMPRVSSRHYLPREDTLHAPFGRGGVVRLWETSGSLAAMLDPDYPLAEELRRLLLRMEQVYPLAPFISAWAPLTPLPRRPWHGDKNQLFGKAIRTNTLLSIGVLGWTHGRLSYALNVGKRPIEVYRAIHKLEREGVLTASRPPGPGADVRALTISETFRAHDELLALIHAHLRQWPEFSNSVKRKMLALKANAREHLRRRGLWPYPVTWKPSVGKGRPSTRKRVVLPDVLD